MKGMLPSILIWAVLAPQRLLACPYCGSEVSDRVWAGIFNGDFWLNAALTLLPIPVLLAIVALIHFGLPWPVSKLRLEPRTAVHD